ncbi:MAG: thiamine pyrophosphate-dependent enzyme [Chlamydiota bacterium]
MPSSLLSPADSLDSCFSPSFIRDCFSSVMLARLANEKMGKLVLQNKGSSFLLDTKGHELIGTLAAKFLIPGKDWAFPYYRDRSFVLSLGCSLEEIFASFLAKKSHSHSSGRMMPDHYSDLRLRIPVQSSVVGSQFLQAVGMAQAILFEGRKEIVYVSSGEGGTSQGDFHEALNYAALHALPLVFVIQDNGWAISVTSEEQTTGGCIGAIASGYPGVASIVVDGTNYPDTIEGLHRATRRARCLEGPTVLVAKIPRIGPHSSSDDPQKYKTEQDLQEDQARDPVALFRSWIQTEGIASGRELEEIERKAHDLVETAASQAEALSEPDVHTVGAHLFSPYTPPASSSSLSEGEPIVMVDAIREGLVEEMEKDSSIVLFGQDVAGGKGGVFGVTRDMTKRFGKERCFNTPLAESTIVGLAIGMGLSGAFRPVAEIQFCDYSWTAMNQIMNELASIHYRSAGVWSAPVTIRMPYGAYIQGGPYHSQRVEAFFAHCPGLKVVLPSNAADAKRLIKTAVSDPNPVIFLEHKALYRQRAFAARPEPGKEEYLPFGKAACVKSGTDISVITYGMMTMFAEEVAKTLEKEGISIEVIDLRTLVPLDQETISSSVRKTGKVCLLQEASLFLGIGAEIAAQIAERDFSYLDAPICRIGAEGLPVPYAKSLERAVLPSKESIEQKLRDLYRY